MSKITPFLWFDDNAEDAITFYVSIFKDSKIIDMQRYPEGAPPPARPGDVMSATFELAGQRFMALNAGPQFQFNEAISMYVDCKDQTEIDYYWNALLQGGGEESMCGWLKDRFGLSWQIVPHELPSLLQRGAMNAMLQMRKLDLSVLRAAAN